MDAASRIRPLDTSAFSLEQRQIWDHAVHTYQDYFRNRFGPKDLVFDDELVRINAQLAIVADDGSSLPNGIPDQVLQALKDVAPTYRATLWSSDDAANRAWIDWAKPLVATYGDEITAMVEGAMQQPWPNKPVRVDVSKFTSTIGGAYTTDNPPHTTLSSERIGHDWNGFEILFHEPTHLLTGKLESALDAECNAQQVNCGTLWHLVLFYTVGEAVKQTLQKHGVAEYVTYAEAHQLYERGDGPNSLRAIKNAWAPYLQHNSDFAPAVKNLVVQFSAAQAR